LNFRYPQLGFPSAVGSQKGQKRAPRSPQKPEKAPKSQETNSHVAQGKNTNNAVVSSRKYKGLRGFCPRKN